MIQTTTITQKWQMTLPKKIRILLGLKKPGAFLLEVVDKKEKLIKLKESPSILALAGSIPAKYKKGKNIDKLDLGEYMEKNYERI